ncbi:Aldo/keto reductase [Mycena indigotica]|uniref:Aldo/keto reductase n=1 Tax=Mycena indigotica TaxID=2126181 RepID=A0A8H6S7T8_9AGAR|nr:Aldo/keto reductase [Mycena indigotica]KAF7293696.1 Aldo/keto reductase [Mycena indigotica]
MAEARGAALISAGLQNLTANPLKIQPVEISYWVPQPALLDYSKKHSLLLEAYSPLGGDGKVGDTLRLPVVTKIASQLGMTPAQVIVSWSIQRVQSCCRRVLHRVGSWKIFKVS